MAKNDPPRVFLSAEWRDLAMLNYEVDPAILREWVPAGTSLDLWRGKAFVSMVGFRFLKTRVLGIPIPFHRDFDEVNLRLYVRRETSEGVRRGVVFVKEIVPRFAIAWVARNVYNERYISLPMRHRVVQPGDAPEAAGQFRYEWRTGPRWNRLEVGVRGAAELRPEDSEEAFITEHYWGYARQPNGSTLEYQVEHPRWRVWRAVDSDFDCDVESLYGPKFAPFLRAQPSSAFVADGSPVTVRSGRLLV